MKNRFVYDPVPFRRLGRSPEVDLVPFKTCTVETRGSAHRLVEAGSGLHVRTRR